MDIKEKNIMKRVGFLPQKTPNYDVKCTVYPERLECKTTCPECHTEINFTIHGQTKFMSDDYIARCITFTLNRNHTRHCPGMRAAISMQEHYADIIRGSEQQQEREYRRQRGIEAPAPKRPVPLWVPATFRKQTPKLLGHS